jgi:hypothetical protein
LLTSTAHDGWERGELNVFYHSNKPFLMADADPDSGGPLTRGRWPSVVIFLDVDGVILPFGDAVPIATTTEGSLFPDSCLAALTHITSKFSDVRLVLSSTWRVQATYRGQILESFHAYGRALGGPLRSIEFHDITDPTLHLTRQAEINAWLHSNRYRGAWIALDDEELVEGEENNSQRQAFCGRVVKTASHIGLTCEDAQQALTLLENQLQSLTRNGE